MQISLIPVVEYLTVPLLHCFLVSSAHLFTVLCSLYYATHSTNCAQHNMSEHLIVKQTDLLGLK